MSDAANVPTASGVAGVGALRRSGATLLETLKEGRIGGLDSLRALAVFFVMLGHGMDETSPPALRAAASGLGSLGVEIFFVLSGFLITWLLLEEHDENGRIDYLAFYKRRIARLMPVFYLFLAIALSVLWLRGREVPWGAVASAMLYVVNYYQGLTGAETNIVAHCWSLAVEEQFYIVWPVAAGALMARRVGLARALVIVIACVWVWRAALFLSETASVSYLYRALETRADHLGVGCLLAVALRSPVWRTRLEALCQWRPLPLVLWLLLYVSGYLDSASGTYKYCVGYVVEPLLIALLIPATVLGSAGNGWAAAWVNNAALVHLGRISYGVYLFHGMVMYTAQRLVIAWTGSFALGFLAACAAVILWCSVVFRWYEVPMRRWITMRWAALRR